MPLEILTVPCLSDNYAYLLRDAATGEVGLVDAPESAPIEAALRDRGWGLDLILITHHHGDHIDGVEALRAAHDARVVGAAADRQAAGARPGARRGRYLALGQSVARVYDVVEQGGHAGDRGDPALAVHVDVRALQTAGEQRGDEPPGALAQHRWIGAAVERVQVGKEHVHVPGRVGREIRQRPDRADVVAEVQIPGRLDPVRMTVGRAVAGSLIVRAVLW